MAAGDDSMLSGSLSGENGLDLGWPTSKTPSNPNVSVAPALFVAGVGPVEAHVRFSPEIGVNLQNHTVASVNTPFLRQGQHWHFPVAPSRLHQCRVRSPQKMHTPSGLDASINCRVGWNVDVAIACSPVAFSTLVHASASAFTLAAASSCCRRKAALASSISFIRFGRASTSAGWTNSPFKGDTLRSANADESSTPANCCGGSVHLIARNDSSLSSFSSK